MGISIGIEPLLEPLALTFTADGFRCRIPVKVAQIIKNAPQLVSEAVHCFVHRTPGDMKVAARMEKFKSENFTVVMTHMHRSSYAQLVQQHFQPPKGYPIPGVQDPGYKGAILGVKLLAGFEILYHRSNSDGDNASEVCTDAITICMLFLSEFQIKMADGPL